MTVALVLFGILAAALSVFALRTDTYSSPPAAVGLSAARAAVVALLAVLALPRPEAGPDPPRLLVLMDEEAQAAPETPRRLSALAAQAASRAERVAILAAGPPRVETPALDGDAFLGHPLARFPTMDVALEAARWEAARSGTCRVAILAGRELPFSHRELGAAGFSVLPVPPPRTRAIRSLLLPAEGFAGAPVEVRLETEDAAEAESIDLFLDDAPVQTRPFRARDGRPVPTQRFSLDLPSPGPHIVSVLVRDAEGRAADRRSAAISVKARPRILYVSPPGLPTPLQELLQRRSFEVTRYTLASLLDEKGSPLAMAGRGDLVVLDSPSPAFLGALILEPATKAVFDRGASLLLVAGDSLRETDRGAALERIWPARLGLDRPDTGDRNLALVAVVDTSMSMAYPDWDSGRPDSKIDMAKLAVSNLARAIRDKDRLGVLGSDFNPYWVVNLADKPDPLALSDLVGRIVAFGPGINLYSSLLAAIEGLDGVEADIKHVLALVDTADIDEVEVSGTGTVWDLLERYRRGGITISIVGFGGSDEAHVPFLNRFTEASGGFLYLASRMTDVPGFFLEDLKQVGDSLVVRGPQNVVFRREEFPALEAMPPVQGQVLVTPKPGASVLAWTERDYCLVSTWRVGRGSVGLFASDNGGPLAPGWAEDAAGPLWDDVIAKLLPSDPPAQVFADVGRREKRVFVRIREPAAPAAPVARWFRPGMEPVSVALEMTAPFEYAARVPDLGFGSFLLEVTDGGGSSAGPLAALSVPIAPPGDVEVPAGASEPPSPAGARAAAPPWSDPRIFRLLLLLAVGLLVIDELFKAP